MSYVYAEETPTGELSNDDRLKEVKAFDDSKVGVKGLVDVGLVNIPKIFIRPPDELAEELNIPKSRCQVPTINLDGIHQRNRHNEIVDEVRVASQTWGFFQILNHGVPKNVLDDIIEGICKFNESDQESKKEFYSRDPTRQVTFNTNYDLYQSNTANWRDSLVISLATTDQIDPAQLPPSCRNAIIEFKNHVTKLGDAIFQLLSEALGLTPGYLEGLECSKVSSIAAHYYPACPFPELTMGVTMHTDASFLTILLQDQIGGLQVLHENELVEVDPIEGALIINIGDFLQLISNDKFKSIKHRVVANSVGPRISVACFFLGAHTKIYGPIKDLISESEPAIYRNVLARDFMRRLFSRGLNEGSGLPYYRL